MYPDSYEIRQCPSCGLRYPLIDGHPFGKRCPSCLGETEIVMQRKISQFSSQEPRVEKNSSVKAALLDNIRSAWNVGAIFRTADGFGLEKLYLCGITSTPENESVRKTSLGAEESVDWEYSPNALVMAKKLKGEGDRLVALEQDSRAIPIHGYRNSSSDTRVPILILGNEVTGVDPEILDLCDQIVHIPMQGQKQSLNVEVAFGIAIHTLSGIPASQITE